MKTKKNTYYKKNVNKQKHRKTRFHRKNRKLQNFFSILEKNRQNASRISKKYGYPLYSIKEGGRFFRKGKREKKIKADTEDIVKAKDENKKEINKKLQNMMNS